MNSLLILAVTAPSLMAFAVSAFYQLRSEMTGD